MRPTPVRPKRSDFASFDDYFDAMIEYHMQQSSKDPGDLQTPTSFVQPFDLARPDARELASGIKASGGGARLPGMKQAWRQQLQHFVQLHQQ